MAIESRDQAVTAKDLRILQKADALLKDASVWNRHDDRVCDDDEAGGKRSLFRALPEGGSGEPLGALNGVMFTDVQRLPPPTAPKQAA